MPLIRCDYNAELFPKETYTAFMKYLLAESMRIFNTDEDHISIFSSPFRPGDLSTAIAEIEYRAAKTEFLDETLSEDEKRMEFLAQLTDTVKKFKHDNALPAGIILTLTIENWKVEWIE